MMRFAVWAAVSTKQQARKDKVSLDDQLADCRRLAKSRGWTESAGPFIVPGESRSRWINLSDAASALPGLAALIASAQHRDFDVLLCWDTTRFRDLLSPIHRFLDDQRIQLYSLAQPIEPVSPETYDPRENDTAEILYDVNAMASRLESKHKQRRWRSGVTGRIGAGMHFARIPFGYRKPPGREESRKVVVELDPLKAPLVRTFADQYLAGRSLSQLAELAAASGVPTPYGRRWLAGTIRKMLLNPFYAGFVFFGRNPTRRDRLTGRTLVLPEDPARMLVTRGQHPPLWDEATQARIRAEFKRRGHASTGKRTHTLSRLLRCETCGAALWYKDNRTSARGHALSLFWRCSTAIQSRKAKGHVHIRDDMIRDMLITELQRALRHVDELPASRPAADRRTEIRVKIADLTARRQRWLDAFETGTLQADVFAERVHDLDAQLADARQQADDDKQAALERTQRRLAVQSLAETADELPAYIRGGDPQEVNTVLHRLLAAVYVTPARTLRLEWRT